MTHKKLNVMRIATGFVATFAVAAMPFAGVNAVTNIWNGTTDLSFGTTTNWSTGAVPLDGDSIVFDSTNTTTAYPTTASLTNATGNAFAGLTAQGSTGSYNFTINALKTAANATLNSTNAATNLVNITALTAQGNVTLDGVSAGTISLPSGGVVTLKNLTTLPTSITGATSIILDNDGTITSSNILAFNHANVTLTGTSTASVLTLASDTLAKNYPLTIAGNSIITLAPNTTFTTPITMTGGQMKMSGSGTTTLSTLAVTTGPSQYVLPASAYLYATSYTVTSPGTFTAGFGNAGTFTGTATTTTTTTTTPTTTTTTPTTATATPTAPNTAFKLALANPFVIAAATIAIVAAGFGIMRLRKQQ